jgi:CheY-like chemotaxis protein
MLTNQGAYDEAHPFLERILAIRSEVFGEDQHRRESYRNPTVSSSHASLKADMSAIDTIRVMLVEDHVAFRQALASLLSHEPDLEVVAQAGSLAQARKMLDRRLDVAVVDLGLPDGDGSALIGELRLRNPGISVLVLSAAMGPGHLDDAVKARADAVLGKVESIPTIAEKVRRLAGG